MKFAANTDVSVERSKAEIEGVVMRYGANGFISGWLGNEAMITFEMRDRRIRFILPLPERNAEEYTHRRVNQHATTTTPRSPEEAYKAWEQACRQKWRALALAVKAKLEAVESGISSFEEEFLAHIVLPTGLTIGQTIVPGLPQIVATGKLPPLLPAPNSSRRE